MALRIIAKIPVRRASGRFGQAVEISINSESRLNCGESIGEARLSIPVVAGGSCSFELRNAFLQIELNEGDELVASGNSPIQSLKSLGHIPLPILVTLCQCFLDFETKERV